ncbi:hypothetical protein GYMLUDRAFT_237025 [Collybiopsis luxurians FD-317 M1]|nr:hypothetical protein GYMLUDRAFT_237025 [Collybiopsis luxurians FD-317 M1]
MPRDRLKPAEKLPPELLSAILHLVLASELREFERHKPIVVLSSVCSIWRALVVETPTFWRKIHIFHTSVDFLRLRLRRSKLVPLSFYISSRYHRFDSRVLTLLVEYPERWEEVDFNIDVRHYALLSPLRGHIPLLKRLKIRTENSDHTPRLSGFEIAPALREVDISYVRDHFLQNVYIPLAQLTELKCVFFQASFLPSILSRVSNLSRLYISRPQYAKEEGFDISRLDVNLSPPDISCPDLRALKMRFCEISLLHSFLARSSNLTTLQICNLPHFTPHSFAEVTLPHLHRFTVGGEMISPEFLKVLKFLRAPNLSVLEFETEWNGPKRYGEFMGAIREFINIVRSGCKLKMFKVFADHFCDEAPEMVLPLQEMASLEHLCICAEFSCYFPVLELIPTV